MSFNPQLLIKLQPSTLFTQPATIPAITPQTYAPQFWMYNAGADTTTTVETNGYFYYFADWVNTLQYNNGQFFQVGDLIYCVCSDANVWLEVSQIGSIIETIVMPVSAGSVVTASIANNAVTTAKIANGNVTLAKLSSTTAPQAIIKYSAQYMTEGGAAAEAITVTGALSTDLAFVQLVSAGTNNVSVVKAVLTSNTLTVTFSGDPGNNAIINYQITRAAS